MFDHPYEAARHFSLTLGREIIETVSKPGLPDWDELLPATSLLAEYADILPTHRVLLFGSHHGALSVYLAHRLDSGKLWITDRDYVALDCTRHTLSANRISPATILIDPTLAGIENLKVDTVLMQLPKGRKLARRWLLQAYAALDRGGRLYLAGAKVSGIQSAIKDGRDLFGEPHILGYKKGNRIARLVRDAKDHPYPQWANEPGIAPGTWKEFSISIAGHDLNIRSLPGVFSYDHLDAGTQMLLNTVNIPHGARVLDVGCGYGVIGMFAAQQAASWVDMVDSDLLAIQSCRENLSLNHVSKASVVAGDLLEPFAGHRFDLILSNPPFHAGLGVDYQIAQAMIRQSYQALNPGGQIVIVANRFIHYDRLIKEIFENVSCMAESGKFHVLSGIKSGS